MLLGLLSLERKLVSRLGLPEYHPEPQGLRQARVSHTKPPGIFAENLFYRASCTGARDRCQESTSEYKCWGLLGFRCLPFLVYKGLCSNPHVVDPRK